MIIFTVLIIIVLLALLVVAFGRKGNISKKIRTAPTLDKNFVQNKWTEIEQTFSLGGPSHFKSAILEADKLVDYVLKSKNVKGKSFGERLQKAQSRFSNYSDYNNLWFAHKVRNNIAHEATHELNSAEAKKAIEFYKKALAELGVLS